MKAKKSFFIAEEITGIVWHANEGGNVLSGEAHVWSGTYASFRNFMHNRMLKDKLTHGKTYQVTVWPDLESWLRAEGLQYAARAYVYPSGEIYARHDIAPDDIL